MEYENLRPILSGLLGAVIAIWLGRAWSRWVPLECARKSATSLKKENRTGIIVANGFFLAGLFGAILLYQSGYFERNDWRPLGLGFGIASTAPLLWLCAYALLTGRRVKEIYVAYSISEQTPPFVLYGIMSAGVICLFAALASLNT
jgi:hypothetical protein